MNNPGSEWTAVKICAIVFGILGAVFAVLGTVFGIFIDEIAASPNSHGNVYVIPWVFGAIGAVFLIVFAVMLSVLIKRKNARKRMLENGRYINACVVEVKQNLLVKINRFHPWYVICEGTNPYTGEKMYFRSADVRENLSYLLGTQLRVFTDPENPKNYYVELHRNYGM